MDLDLRGELYIGGTWVDATGKILKRQSLTHTRGRQDQGARVDPSTLRPLLNNTDGRFSPDNPNGEYYGEFGRNTEFRLSLRAGSPALDLPGNAGDYVSTPDHSSLDITGDIDIRLDATLPTWRGDTNLRELAGKYDGTGNQRSWALFMWTDHRITFRWSADGSTVLQYLSPAPVPVPPSGRLAVRVTLDVDNGASGHTVTFYTAPSGTSGLWTQLGAPVTGSGVTSIFSGTAPLVLGDVGPLGFERPAGRLHAFELRNGINGAVAASPNFGAQTVGATSFVDGAGRTWTVSGGASITNRRTRLSHELAAYPTEWHPSGAHAWVDAQTAGILRRLRRGEHALDSTLRRRIPSFSPLAYWPLEEGANATQAYSPIAGVRPLRLTRVNWAQANSLPSSNPLPVLASSGGDLPEMLGKVPAPATTLTSWHVQWVYRLDQGNATTRTFLRVLSTGTVAEWYIQSSTGNSTVLGKDADGNTVFTQLIGTGTDLYGQWVRVKFEATQNGGNVDWVIIWTDVGGDAGQASASFAGTVGRPTGVAGPPNGYSADLNGMAIGHISVWPSNSTAAYDRAIDAWTGETAGERMQRLADEETIPLTVCGAVAEQTLVGPQLPDAVLNLLEEAGQADGGILYEDREQPALRYRDRAGMYNQTPALVLDYTAPGLAPPLKPTGDDDATENDVTVTRVGGSSGRAFLEEGALSIQAPPSGVGTGYDSSYPLNLHSDDQAEPIAYWRMWLGTYEGRRYPQVHVMVHKAPALADQVLAVDVGDKIVIQNPPKWVAPGDIELIVQGYEETFTTEFTWDIVFNCTPGRPWTVGVVGDDELGRVDSDRTELVSAVTDTATTLITHVPPNGQIIERQPWIYSGGPAAGYPNLPAEFPFDVQLGGEVVRATAIEPAVWDVYGRTVSNGWGTSDSGHAWTTSGGSSSDYSVGSGYGAATQSTLNVSRLTLATAPSADVDLVVDIASSALATGASLFAGPLARAADVSNWYMARVEFTTAAAIILSLRKRVSGAETQLGTFTSPLTHTAGTFYRVRMLLSGSSLKAKIWLPSSPEPGVWHIEVTDSSLTAANNIGTRSIAATGNTNTSPQLRFDNFHLRTPQEWTATRSINGIVKAQSAGTLVGLAQPAVVAL